MKEWLKLHEKERRIIKGVEKSGRKKRKRFKGKKRKPKKKRYLKYADYLKSGHWKRVKERFKGSVCYVCGTSENIHVHHKTYKRKGREPNKDLLPLCGKHHGELHKLRNKEGLKLEDVHEKIKSLYYEDGNDPMTLEFEEITKNF